MKRFVLVTAVPAAAAAMCFGISTSSAAAEVHGSGSVNAQVTLEHKVEQKIQVVDNTLARIERSSATQRLDAEVRGEVRASINADQSALADLETDVNTAATLAEVREVGAQVADYQASVYVQAVATLNRAEALQERVDDARLTVTLSLTASGWLDRADAALDATVDGASTLGATSSRSEVRAVKADLRAAVGAYAAATS